MNQGYEKLEMFERKIMAKAQEECRKIQQETAEMKRTALEQEENRLLADIYRHIQLQISQIRTENVKEVSKKNADLKRELYQQREQYVTEILSRARVELMSFTKSEAYQTYLTTQAATLRQEYDCKTDVLLLVCAKDLVFASAIEQAFGTHCEVKVDDRISIGGIILSDPTNSVEEDRTLDAALASQRAWLSAQPDLQFEFAKNN